MKLTLVALCMMIGLCGFSQTQLELNQNADKKCKAADKELNRVYQQILSEYAEDTVFLKNLKAAQIRWIQFKDAEMLAIYPDREEGYYGSIQPLCWSMTLTEMIEERTKQLKVWLVGVEEVDVCGGSVKRKEY